MSSPSYLAHRTCALRQSARIRPYLSCIQLHLSMLTLREERATAEARGQHRSRAAEIRVRESMDPLSVRACSCSSSLSLCFCAWCVS